MGTPLTHSVGGRGQTGWSGKAASEALEFWEVKEVRESQVGVGESVPGRGNSQCKGPGAAMCLALKKKKKKGHQCAESGKA